MRQKIASITQLFRLPAICGLCNQYHSDVFAVCNDCQQSLTPLGPACRHCAQPLPDNNFLVCGRCCQKKPFIDNVITAYCFDEPLRVLLHEFKYREGLHLLTFLTQLMINALPDIHYKTECLIPVPMHPKRLRARGFNQAAELTKQLHKKLNLPYDLHACKKIVNTPAQAGLNAKMRSSNLRNAFSLKGKIKGKNYQHITLVDDLMTTGSTANELARTLKKQGVAQVDLWCCAKVIND